jgi:hypothetical protein
MIALDLMGKRNVNIKDWIKCDTDRCDKRLTMEKGTVAKKITIEKVPLSIVWAVPTEGRHKTHVREMVRNKDKINRAKRILYTDLAWEHVEDEQTLRRYARSCKSLAVRPRSKCSEPTGSQ